jgi:type I restriction enzyme S subunit
MDGEFRCYEWTGPNALLNQRVCRIQDFNFEAVVPRYIFFAVNQHLEKIEQNTGYTTVKHISAKQILDIEIPLPSIPEQKRIVDLMTTFDAMMSSLESAIKETTLLRTGLLHNLMSGKHEIPSSYNKVLGAA